MESLLFEAGLVAAVLVIGWRTAIEIAREVRR